MKNAGTPLGLGIYPDPISPSDPMSSPLGCLVSQLQQEGMDNILRTGMLHELQYTSHYSH